MRMKKILLVEDDKALAYGMEVALKSNKYHVSICRDVASAKEAITHHIYDMAILDIDLPDGTGYEICQYIRSKSDLPIIFLSGLSEEINVVTGLDMGGDDYITKPFQLSILLSRMNAIFRRFDKKDYTILESGDICFWLKEVRLTKDNKQVPISITEYKLLKLLMNHAQTIVTKEQILHYVWDIDENYVDENAIAVNIKRIRSKIEDNPAKPSVIKTVRGLGYIWNGRCEKR